MFYRDYFCCSRGETGNREARKESIATAQERVAWNGMVAMVLEGN